MLAKIPFLLALAALHPATIRPPNPPARADTLAGSDKLERNLCGNAVARWFAAFSSAGVIVLCAFECLDIAARAYPHAWPSQLAGQSRPVTSTFVLGFALALAGSIIRLSAYRALGPMFTFELSRGPTDTLVTTGPYAFVRHPSYTGYALHAVGAALCLTVPAADPWYVRSRAAASIFGRLALGLWTARIGLLLAMFLRRTGKEDELLRARYGRQWADWAERVRYRLVPGVF